MEKEISEVKIYSKLALSAPCLECPQNNMIANGPRLHRGFHRMDAAQGSGEHFSFSR